MKLPEARSLITTSSMILTAAYPLAVYLLLSHGEIRIVGVALIAIAALRLFAPGPAQLPLAVAVGAGVLFAVAIILTRSATLACLYPAAVSVALLSAFGITLVRPPSMIERIARATGASMDEAAVRYTRNLTFLWCGFFLVNGCIAVGTAFFASREAWALYNGFISYVIAGTLFLGERLVRPAWRRRISGTA